MADSTAPEVLSTPEPGHCALEDFSVRVSTICFLAEQPSPHLALAESLQAARTLASVGPSREDGSSSLEGESACGCMDKNKATLENTKWIA